MNNNYSMLLDLYEFTMSNGILHSKNKDTICYFDMFFRRVPDEGGFAIMAGLEQLIDYLKNLKFTKEDIDYLKSLNLFCEEFLDFLRDFKFSCDVWAVPEGTPIFPNEPIITVRGPAMQAFIVETMVLLTINHQSLIATKANRIVRAANGKPVMEFGARRAHGTAASVYGARAAIIGGCAGTSCVMSAQKFGAKPMGTMAHSWVQLFDSEYEAFKTYAEEYPESCLLFVDTYNVLQSGLPNAIKVFDDVLQPKGYRPAGIRIDSGDFSFLSSKCRKNFDEAGYPDCKICISNSLDEYLIRDLLIQGAAIDSYGVGVRLITASSEAVFGGVYKLVATEDESGNITPKIKISENTAKVTIPGVKDIYRLYDNETNMAIADVISLKGEKIEAPFTLFDPVHTWKRKTVTDFTAVPLRKQIFDKGELVYELPKLSDIAEYSKTAVNTLWDEGKRFEKPHTYYVDLTQNLWDLREKMLKGDK